MASFKGTFTSTIDLKRRLKLPKKLKDAIPSSSNENFVITTGFDGCIYIYTKEEWEKKEEKLKQLTEELEEERYYGREVFQKSEDVKIDRAGRLTIPQVLLDDAQIKPKEEIWIFGVLSRIEIWNPEEYRKYKENFAQTREQVAQKIFKPKNVGDKK